MRGVSRKRGGFDVEGRQATERAVPVMEVGPPGSPCRRRVQTTASCVRPKSPRGERCGKRPANSGSGVRREDEHVQTTADASKCAKTASKPGSRVSPGTKARPAWRALSQGASLPAALAVPGVEVA